MNLSVYVRKGSSFIKVEKMLKLLESMICMVTMIVNTPDILISITHNYLQFVS